MKSASAIIASTACLLVLMGCATPLRQNQSRLTVSTNPPGATLFVDGNTAAAPERFLFTGEPGPAWIAHVTARWVSGATVTHNVKLQAGKDLTYTIQRPNVAGVEADIKWAIQLRQEAAANDQAFVDALRSYNNSKEAANRSQGTQRFSTDCTTMLNGNVARTSCF